MKDKALNIIEGNHENHLRALTLDFDFVLTGKIHARLREKSTMNIRQSAISESEALGDR
ncbi:MAG: hypothetical protein QNJ55_34555 [Xenococcus sp. MO_188.B8]|nr:hypothetical protein [Xenococcus sp. MO_188.B8]